MEIKYPDITVELCGHDGNAFSILAQVIKAMKRSGVSPEEIDNFKKEAMSGDYDHLLQTTMGWVNVT